MTDRTEDINLHPVRRPPSQSAHRPGHANAAVMEAGPSAKRAQAMTELPAVQFWAGNGAWGRGASNKRSADPPRFRIDAQ